MGVVREQVVEATSAFGSVFRNRDLRKVNLALAGSVIGDWAFGIAVSVWAYQEGGATAVGVYGVVKLTSLAVLSPFAASFADKYPRKTVMIVADLIRLVLVALGTIFLVTEAPALTIYAASFLAGIVGAAFRPAQASLIPTLADDPTQLTNTNVVASTIESMGFFVGPALAGLLLAMTSLETVFVFNALTFLWSAAVLVGVGPPRAGSNVVDDAVDAAEDATEQAAEEHGGALAGFGQILGNRDLRFVAFMMAAQTVVAGASLVFEVAIIFDLLEKGESTLGLMSSVLGIGGLIGGVVAVLLARRERMALDFGIGVLGWSAPLLLIVAWPTLTSVLIAQLLIGISNSLVDINAYTIVQRVTPEAVMGRVFGALESIIISGMAVGSLAMPILMGWIDLRAALAVVGGTVAAIALIGLPRLHGIDQRVLAPPLLRMLRKVPIFSPVARPAQERIARTLEPRSVPAGEIVFRQGDAGDHYWIIQSGRVEVQVDGERRRELGPGEGFGEIALLRDVPRTATVTAIDDLELLGVARDDFIPAITSTEESTTVAENVVNRYLSLS
jgi:MFS family permease